MKTILIVDASEPILGSLPLAIRGRERDCAVLTATGGNDAVEIMKAFRIDLIITDISAPAADRQCLIEYRNRHHPRLPLLHGTADPSENVTHAFNTREVAESFMHRIQENIETLLDMSDADPVDSCCAC